MTPEMSTWPSPSGIQYEIAHGDAHALVTQVGATLRELAVAGASILDGFSVGDRAADGRGQVLAPWPNRLAGGSYTFGGQACQAPLNEPAKRNAIHGLVRWLDWAPVVHEASSVTLACALRPQPGYEWQLDLNVEYRLADDGLTVTIDAANPGPDAAPLGVGFHPYLTLGRPVDDLELQLPARSYLPPMASEVRPNALPVSGTPLDFSTPRLVGATQLDTCYSALQRDGNGRAEANVIEPTSGERVHLWVDEAFPYLMVYTGDQVGESGRRRRSIAVEPMTCPPNALKDGQDLVRLEPNESWRAQWGVRVTRSADS